jgi:hypothetical protein
MHNNNKHSCLYIYFIRFNVAGFAGTKALAMNPTTVINYSRQLCTLNASQERKITR